MPGPHTLPPHPTLEQYFPDEPERRRFVARIFDETAGDYDWINRAMSLGSGGRYRRMALLSAGLAAGMRVLDVACGTGLVSHAAEAIAGAGRVVALDPSTGMTRECKRRTGLPVLRAAAEHLPFPAERFDFLSMGYALRHVSDLRVAFAEYARVLKPGGRLLLLELTRPRTNIGTHLAKAYLHGIVPRIAALRGGQSAGTLMRYFWDTIEHCVPPETILAALVDAGFDGVDRRRSMGLFSEYRARKSGG